MSYSAPDIVVLTHAVQDCMVGLLFAFMPVLSHQPGQELDRADVFRLLIKCASIHVTPNTLFL